MAAIAPSAFAALRYFCNTASMSIAVTITSRGVITLPARVRRALGLKADDQLIAEVTPDGLLLRPAVTLPVEIYTPAREREFDQSEAELAAVLKPKTRAPRAGAATQRRSPARSR
jgi:AbrB family looped-hinge helix DNA binding protein